MRLLLLFFLVSLSFGEDTPTFLDFEQNRGSSREFSQELHLDAASMTRPFDPGEDNTHQPIYSYEKYFGSVMPDVAVRLGRQTVKRWSHRWLYKEGLPVRFIRYDIVGDSLEFNITVDYEYFRNRKSIDLVAPTYGVGEVFKPVGSRKAYDREKDGSQFVVDLRFRLRFPLLGYQNPEDRSQDNTLYMQFTRQAIQAYYLDDFNTYLEKLDQQMNMMLELNGLEAKGAANPAAKERSFQELEELERKLAQNGSLSPADEERLAAVNRTLHGDDFHMILKEKLLTLDAEIERFQSGSILPFVPSNEAVKDLLEKLSAKKAFSDYLAIEIHEYQGLAGGIIKVAGLNRVIEGRFPGLDIYFVGIDKATPANLQFFGQDVSKILVAGRIRQ